MNSETTAPLGTIDPSSQRESLFHVVDLGALVLRLWNRRFLILGASLAGGLIATLYAFLLHPQYDAVVTLMPPNRGASSLLASLSPARNEGDFYLGLISSRTVADDVIERQHLAQYFHVDKPTYLRSNLAKIAKIGVDRNQFITITVRSPDPQKAMDIANAFPEALARLNRSVAESQAQYRYDFFAGPLEREKNRLADAEEQLKVAQQKTGVVMPEAQLQLGLSAIATLKQQITGLNQQLAALLTGSTDQNPQVIQLKSQIASLTGQLGRLQSQNGGTGSSASSAQVPALTLEIERKARDVKFHETLLEVLSRQDENARIEDAFSPAVELVDRAVLPDVKSWPSHRQFFLIGLLLGALGGVGYACFRP